MILPLPFMGGGERGTMFYDTNDVPEDILPVIKSTRLDLSGRYDLINFSTELLKKTMSFLYNDNSHIALQREIEKELGLRSATNKKCDDKRGWFVPLWWAVVSLFGKGEMDMNSRKTQELLDSIKPEWVNNCRGRNE